MFWMFQQSRARNQFWIAIAIGLSAAFCSVEVNAADKAAKKKAESAPGQFVVELAKNRNLYDHTLLERRLGGKIIREVRENVVTIQRDARENRERTVERLSRLAEVRIAEPNYILRAIGIPNDTDFGKQWALQNIGGLDSEGTKGIKGLDISAEKAWDIERGDKRVIVAIIDTGIDYNHPDLKNNIWTNELEAQGKPGVDDDGNGYIDDIHGYNFVNNTGNPLDDNGHGTHVSGTIGAEPDNGLGVAGVNWNVSLIAVKFLDADGGGTLDAAIQAVDYARKSQAKILSNSWGGQIVSQILEKAVGETNAAGQLFVAAAGNDSDNNDTGSSVPSTYKFENVVSVAAADNRGQLASFSNYGSKSVHLAAPGVNILSTVNGNRYDTYSGTSMACPHVSGVAALLLAQNPQLSNLELKDRLLKSSRPLMSLKGKVITGGFLDAYYALTELTPPADPNDPSLWAEQADYELSSPHPYADKAATSYKITIPGAKRIAVHFSKFETEAGYDKLQFLTPSGESFGAMSGVQSGRFGPVIDGDTVILKFTSDTSVSGYGFDVDSVAFEAFEMP